MLIPVPDADQGDGLGVALRVTCIVYAKGKKRQTWTAHSIIPLSAELPGAISTTSVVEGNAKMADGPREYQREADEEEIKEVEREERQREASEDEIQKVEREEKD